MNQHELIENWKREEQQPFTGWDFSYLDGRMLEEQPSWSYSARAAELMRQASSVLDLVLNRHSGFNANEVARVLAANGTFLTQQVHGLWVYDLLAAFGARPQWPTSTPDKYVPQLEAAGLTVLDTREWAGQLAFTDVGAIVYYLKAVPWLVPGFSVETHASYLLELHDRQEKGQALAFAAKKYLIEARKVR